MDCIAISKTVVNGENFQLEIITFNVRSSLKTLWYTQLKHLKQKQFKCKNVQGQSEVAIINQIFYIKLR